ncbi:MAG: hypothetical protein PHR28_14330 [candidate division Zixibacteria bacterium]|nr:hypothetical protein [candidate division Zixibacteria bacterium]
MTTGEESYPGYDNFRKKGTGEHEAESDAKTVVVSFGKYEIVLKLTSTNEFIGIQEIRVNKDFRNWKQKTTARGFHDVDEFYRE